ncbi:MAG TPA: hypothetical protein V6C89_00115 [Drouetiella sp.]|jgi:hypothetical protein
MHYQTGLWHKFLAVSKKAKVFEVCVQGSVVYWRLGMQGTKCATRKIQNDTEQHAEKVMYEMIDKKLAEGFVYQHSAM